MKVKNHIGFKEEDHSYRNLDTNNVYTSITTWISKIKTPFVADESKTLKTQKKLGLTHEEVLNLWKQKNEVSKKRGTYIHNTIESILLSPTNSRFPIKTCIMRWRTMFTNPDYDKSYNLEVPFEYLYKLKKKKCALHIEDLLYWDKHQLAGQSDLVLEYKNHIEILDWKTNEKDDLNKVEWYTNNFENIFTELKQTSYNEYAIQMVLYGLMAEMIYGKKCKKHTIVHIYGGCKELVIPKDLVEYIKGKLKFLFE